LRGHPIYAVNPSIASTTRNAPAGNPTASELSHAPAGESTAPDAKRKLPRRRGMDPVSLCKYVHGRVRRPLRIDENRWHGPVERALLAFT
jgi:hypothetical protein